MAMFNSYVSHFQRVNEMSLGIRDQGVQLGEFFHHPKRPSTQLQSPSLLVKSPWYPMVNPMVFPWFSYGFVYVCPMFFWWFFYVVPMGFLWFFDGFLWFPHKQKIPAPPGYVPPPPGTRSSHSFEANAVARTSPCSPGEPKKKRDARWCPIVS